MKKLALVCVLALASSSTLAGESKGPPGPDGALGGHTPIAEGRAASICAFSGLNDERVPVFEDTQTQSYGTFLNYFAENLEAIFGVPLTGVEAKKFVKGNILPSPGEACNPTFEG